jgi:hypothetical protein
MSVAAWKGFFQLITNPFYWEKTTHGLHTSEATAAAPRPGPPAARPLREPGPTPASTPEPERELVSTGQQPRGG